MDINDLSLSQSGRGDVRFELGGTSLLALAFDFALRLAHLQGLVVHRQTKVNAVLAAGGVRCINGLLDGGVVHFGKHWGGQGWDRKS